MMFSIKSRAGSLAIITLFLGALPTGSLAHAAGQSVSIQKVDESTVTGTLAGLKDGQIILSSPDAKIPLEDLVVLENKGAGAAIAAPPPVANAIKKLTGTVIGTEGSWNDEGGTRDKAFDGDLETFFDAPADHGDDAWCGLDLGTPKVITQIKFAPRSGGQVLFQRRMIGGRFQGSNSADFSSGVVDLFIVSNVPPIEKLTSQNVLVGNAFRYVRYLSPGQGNGNVAEIEFWGKDATAAARPAAKDAVGSSVTKSHEVRVNTTSAVAMPVGMGPVKPSSTGPSTNPMAAKRPSTAPVAVPTAPSYRVTLAGDDQLTGPLIEWTEKSLLLATALGEGGKLDIPVEALRQVWKGTADQVKQAQAIVLAPGPEDAAFVTKDNAVVVVRGIALGITGDSLRFKFGDEERKINLAKLVGVILGGTEAKRDTLLRQTVVLSSGDTLSGQWKGYDGPTNAIALETPWGAALRIPFTSVARVRSANGRLVYLSDLKPIAVEQVPYFDRLLGYRVDKSLTGGVLKLSDGDYARGIAVHSRCVLTYDIGGEYEEFKTKIGFQQPEGKLGQAIVRVLGDEKVLYENLDARGDAKPIDVGVKVAGVHRLVLEVDFGKNEDTGDRVVWANARLLRAKK